METKATEGATVAEKPRVGFPSHYPTQCPPSNAVPPDGRVYYRLVGSDPPTDADVRSHYELGIHPATADECQLRGLSMLATYSKAVAYRRSYKRLRGRFIAAIRPSSGWGVLKAGTEPQSRAHVTLWLYEGTTRSEVVAALELCKEGGQDD